MTSLDSSTVGWSKSGNGEAGVSAALTFFAGLAGSEADSTVGEWERFMPHEKLHRVAD